MSKRFVGQTFPFAINHGIADLAVHQHGPAHLERGGPANRARSVFSKGGTPTAAGRAAAPQGKGFIAEVRVATEFSLDSGLRGRPFVAGLNKLANHPHEDVLIQHGRRKVNNAQVGVGSARYLAAKARRSRASQLVINTEVLDAVNDDWSGFSLLATDTLRHEDARSSKLSGTKAEDDAASILESMIKNEPTMSFRLKASVVFGSGVLGFATSFGRSLLFQAVHRLHAGLPFDDSMITNAVNSGIGALKRTSLATWVQVSRFLQHAGEAFNGKLLRALGGSAAVAGAFADVVVTTARDVVAWVRNKITFEELLRRFGVQAFSAAGALVGGAVMFKVTAGMPGWLAMLLSAAGAAGGGYFGYKLGEGLFDPTWNVQPAV